MTKYQSKTKRLEELNDELRAYLETRGKNGKLYIRSAAQYLADEERIQKLCDEQDKLFNELKMFIPFMNPQ